MSEGSRAPSSFVPAARRRLSVEEYRDQVVALAPRLPRADVPLDQALGRVVAVPVRAGAAVPAFDDAAMDGYAVRAADTAGATASAPAVLPVAWDVPAGDPRRLVLAPGTAARIMTGAPLPHGADAVVPVEDTDGGERTVAVRAAVPVGRHVRLAGEDAAVGDVVVPAGTRLTARHLAAAAAVGAGAVTVCRRPRVAVVVTGSELRDAGLAAPSPGPAGDATLAPGAVYDANGPFLAAALTQAGAQVTARVRVADRPGDLRDALDRCTAEADAVVLAGGVSAGAYDVVRDLLSGDGEVVHVAVQPGKPQGHGRWHGVPLLALPGNPVSCAVSFWLFVRPFLAAATGEHLPVHPRPGRAGAAWSSPAGRRQLVPALLDPGSGTLRPVHPSGTGSHRVTTLARADALAIVPEDVTRVAEGDPLTYLPL